MKVTWENKNSGESFVEHDKCMKMFRKSHPSISMAKVSRRELIRQLWPMLTVDTIETGGNKFHINTADWSTYAPMWRVVLHRLILN